MDIYANRRRWLAHWIDTEYGGNKARAAEATGYSRSQISQFLSETYQEGRSPQEKAARTLEKKFGQPERIMETPAPGTDAPDSSAQTSATTIDRPAVDMAFVGPDGRLVVMEVKRSTKAETPETLLNAQEQARSYLKALPDYVVSAYRAIDGAYRANAPRETFDAITHLFSQLIPAESGKLTAPKKDEAVKSSPAMQSVQVQAERALKDAESHLATRSEDKRAARRIGDKRSKNIRH